jgi:hypothetical protein|tara:strand:+ start:163 stop:345 length:183 start_codon:yes stop_codon:yes gene_type:complete
MNFRIKIKEVYGKKLYYPINKVAVTFAGIAGTKTVSESVLQAAEGLGYNIVVEADDWRNA